VPRVEGHFGFERSRLRSVDVKQMIKRLVPRRLVRQMQSPDRLDEIQRELESLRLLMEDQRHILQSLNHTIVYGGESGLPLLIDIVDRVRTDADTTIGAVHAMELMLSTATDRLTAAAARFEPTDHRPGPDA
jgi:hypothetical protein